MPNVYLVGFMGAGKTSVGRAVAARLGWSFVDLDEILVDRFGVDIATIFARHGEAVFRQAEAEELAGTTGRDRQVVALGGGAYCAAENRRLIEEAAGIAVFLDASWEVIRTRLPEHDPSRPVLGDEEHARQLYLDRRRWYLRARVVVPIHNQQSVDDVAGAVLDALERSACAS
jgi:shikimate kinase